MQARKKFHLSFVKKVILSIIIFLFFTVAVITIVAISNTPEKRIKSRIETLAQDYYENYLYPKIFEKSKNIAETLGEYQEEGLAIVYLRQLLFSDQKDIKTIYFLRNHCNENKTAVRFFPEPPYTKNSYRIEYIYSCDF